MRFLCGLGSRVSPKKRDTEFVEEVPHAHGAFRQIAHH